MQNALLRKGLVVGIIMLFVGTSVIPSIKGNTKTTSIPNQNNAPNTDWWPMFGHDLSHTHYSTSTAPDTNNVLWSYATGYYVASSPAIANGNVYIGSGGGKVYCLDASSGAFIWSYTTGNIIDSSSAVANGNVYIGSWDGKVYCFNNNNQQPAADFTWSPQNPNPGQYIAFDASSSYDPDGYIVLYEWDWNNDGVYDETSDFPTAAYSWSNAGNYPVTLRVTDNGGATDTLTKIVNVGSVNQPPVITQMSISPIVAGVTNPTGLASKGPDPVTFHAEANDPDGNSNNLVYEWQSNGVTYGSGSTFVTSDIPVGEYTITLVVTDENNGQTSKTYDQPLQIVDGLVFRHPFDSSESQLNQKAIQTGTSGSGKELDPEAFLNLQRGDVYVYTKADTLGNIWGSCWASAGQYILFNVESDTQAITVETKIHTIGGKIDSVTGLSKTRIYVGSYYKALDVEWYGPEEKMQEIDPIVGGFELLTLLFGPIGAIVGHSIDTVLDLIYTMASTSIDILDYNTMLNDMKQEKNYREIDFTTDSIQLMNHDAGTKQAVMVSLYCDSGGSFLGITQACRIGLIDYIIIRKSTPPPPPCCFPAGTKITMADGSVKNIEDVKVGDRVLSYDVQNQSFSSWKVQILSRPNHPVYEINNGLINVTRDHPFYVKKQDGRIGWGELQPDGNATRLRGEILQIEMGDKLMTSKKDWIPITNITYHPESLQVYNILSSSGKKTYFANGLLVYEEFPSWSYLIKYALSQKHPLRYVLNLLLQKQIIIKP